METAKELEPNTKKKFFLLFRFMFSATLGCDSRFYCCLNNIHLVQSQFQTLFIKHNKLCNFNFLIQTIQFPQLLLFAVNCIHYLNPILPFRVTQVYWWSYPAITVRGGVTPDTSHCIYGFLIHNKKHSVWVDEKCYNELLWKLKKVLV